MDPATMEPVLAAVKSRKDRPAHRPLGVSKTSSSNTEQEQGAADDGPLSGMAVLLAGAVRALLFTVKRRAVLGFVRKRAFVALGKRTDRTAVVATKSAKSGVKETPATTGPVMEKVGGLLKNITLGISVFFTYEYVVDHRFLGTRNEPAVPEPTNKHDNVVGDKVKPLIAHFGAGACSGLAQTSVLTAWEVLSAAPPHSYWNALKNPSLWLQNVTLDKKFLARRTIHHMVGYASLFGYFELIRRQLLQRFYNSLESGSEWVPIVFEELERRGLMRRKTNSGGNDVMLQDIVTPVTLSAAFVAGGLAGQVHHTVSHYTSHWKVQAAKPTTTSTSSGSKAAAMSTISFQSIPQCLLRELQSMPPPPTFRSTMGAFGPAALCFVAFQYGGELTARMVEQERASNPFPVRCRQTST